MRRASSLLACLCVLLALSAPALAQQTTGTITGRLVDAQGAAVPGVTVTGTQRRRPASCARASPTAKGSIA